MFLRSSNATMATVFLVRMSAIDIVHVLMEATNETVVSGRNSWMSLIQRYFGLEIFVILVLNHFLNKRFSCLIVVLKNS